MSARPLSDAELCSAWCLSCSTLKQDSLSVAERAQVLAVRQELERRDLEGFRRWLAASTGPASDPREDLGMFTGRPAVNGGQPPA